MAAAQHPAIATIAPVLSSSALPLAFEQPGSVESCVQSSSTVDPTFLPAAVSELGSALLAAEVELGGTATELSGAAMGVEPGGGVLAAAALASCIEVHIAYTTIQCTSEL